MGTMYDAVNAAGLPDGVVLAAGYVDGAWPSAQAIAARFPSAYVVGITVTGRANTRVADCETGDLTPQSAARWALDELAAGRRPTIYVSRIEWDLVKAALGARWAEVDYWVADWTGSLHALPGAAAVQYASPSTGSGGPWDLSVTSLSWPVATPPAPAVPVHETTPATKLNKPASGIAATPTGKGYWMVAQDGGVFAFGDAHYAGSLARTTLNAPIVGITPTPSGKGYWLVGADGGVFAFGDAHYAGGMV